MSRLVDFYVKEGETHKLSYIQKYKVKYEVKYGSEVSADSQKIIQHIT